MSDVLAGRELRVLMVEDSPEDAELNAHELRQAGLRFVSCRVQTRDSFVRALDEFRPDVILTDCRLPSFDGREALAIARGRGCGAAAIVVTGALGDELAVELLRAGARDYVLKDRLARLPAAVLRALEEEAESRRRRAAEQALRHNQAWLEGQREVLELIARGEGLPRVCDELAQLLDRLLPASRSALFQLDRPAAALRLLAAPGLSMELRAALKSLSLTNAGTCAAAVADGHPRIVADRLGEGLCRDCRFEGLGSAWVFPLATVGGEVVGALVVHGPEPRAPDPDQRRILDGAAPIAALAIERSRTEQAIRAAAAEWGSTFDALEAAVLIVDGAGRVVRSNRRACVLLGCSPGACPGLVLSDLGAEEPWAEARRALEDVQSGRHGDLRRVLDPRGLSWVVEVTPVAEGAGAGRAIVMLRDVTSIVRLQESMVRAERMAAMGALVAGVAHEVRNPLFAMSVNIDALALVLKGREDVQELLDALCEERDRISCLMEDLLSYGRPSPGERVRAALEPMVQAALRGCAAIASHLRVTLEREGAAEGLELVMDDGRLEEVLHNVLENACRHTPAGGRVVLSVERLEGAAGPRLRMQVRDQGAGFSPEALERAFEPFFTRRRGGTGLGLAIAQRIVEEHGGTVAVANQPAGGGVVTVELPLAAGGGPAVP